MTINVKMIITLVLSIILTAIITFIITARTYGAIYQRFYDDCVPREEYLKEVRKNLRTNANWETQGMLSN